MVDLLLMVCPDCKGWLELKDASVGNPDGIPCPSCADSDFTGMVPVDIKGAKERMAKQIYDGNSATYWKEWADLDERTKEGYRRTANILWEVAFKEE